MPRLKEQGAGRWKGREEIRGELGDKQAELWAESRRGHSDLAGPAPGADSVPRPQTLGWRQPCPAGLIGVAGAERSNMVATALVLHALCPSPNPAKRPPLP